MATKDSLSVMCDSSDIISSIKLGIGLLIVLPVFDNQPGPESL